MRPQGLAPPITDDRSPVAKRISGYSRLSVDDDFADVAVWNRIAAAGADDFDDQPFIDDEAVHGFRFVGDQAEIGAGVGLQALNAMTLEFLAERIRQRLGGNHRLGQGTGVEAFLGGAVQ